MGDGFINAPQKAIERLFLTEDGVACRVSVSIWRVILGRWLACLE